MYNIQNVSRSAAANRAFQALNITCTLTATCDTIHTSLLVPDLGLDQVRGWAMVDADGSLRSLPGAQACFDAPAGCGPRGFVQHPGLPDLAYMICELDGSLVWPRPRPEACPNDCLLGKRIERR